MSKAKVFLITSLKNQQDNTPEGHGWEPNLGPKAHLLLSFITPPAPKQEGQRGGSEQTN